MHAKLTRDRKKLFTAKVCEMIELLERNNRIMLQKLCASSAESPIDIRTKEEKEKMHSYWAPGSLNYLEGKTASAMSELTSI